tara:strand:+ start:131 stop:367 length:237 start_codon:yes stop_codon:yes gene_type:complete
MYFKKAVKKFIFLFFYRDKFFLLKLALFFIPLYFLIKFSLAIYEINTLDLNTFERHITESIKNFDKNENSRVYFIYWA